MINDVSLPPLWTEERVKLLQSMLKAGRSTKHMAMVLGVSENAIGGKLDRLGLRRRQPGTVAIAQLPPPKRFVAKAKDPPGVRLTQLPDLECRKLSLLELTSSSCRWPLDINVSGVQVHCGPDNQLCGVANDIAVFCGLNRMSGSAYCRDHTRLAHPRFSP